jgi:hypothetical protein
MILISSSSLSQNFDFKGSVTLHGIVSNEKTIPFWFFTNTSTALNANTNFSGIGEITSTYLLDNSSFEAGAMFFYRDGLNDEFQRGDLYLSFKNNWIKATLGSKQREQVLEGLSISNQNFLWSWNARPMPGLILEANDPIKLTETFSIDWGIAHYSLNDDRYVENTRVHYKRLGLIVTFNKKNKLKAQIQHFAQWAGTSPTYGDLNDDFSAFIDVFIAAKSPETTSDEETPNALGNHMGSFLLDYELSTDFGSFSIYHEHPFEDGSGTRWANFPDGVWGVFYTPNDQSFLSNILYEYIDTSDQSGLTGGSGIDNYFHNNLYRSGWTYEGNIIGVPLIIADRSIVIDDNTSPIIGNKSSSHHFAAKGSIKNINWMIKSTYTNNQGTFRHPFTPSLKIWYNFISISYPFEKFGTITMIGGIDSSNVSDTKMGGGLIYNYSFH